MALLLRPKYLLVYKTRRGELKNGWGEKRREEEKREEEGKEKKKKKRREEERKRKKVWNYDYEYVPLYRFVWIHVCGLWVVRNLTLK